MAPYILLLLGFSLFAAINYPPPSQAVSKSKAASGGLKFAAKWPQGEWFFNNPIGITTDDKGYVYIVDSGESTIRKFTAAGKLVARISGKDNHYGKFDWGKPKETYTLGNPSLEGSGGLTDLAIGTKENIYVADSRINCIEKFDSTGKFLTKWGGKGGGAGQFDIPQNIAVDVKGNVYVADARNNRVQKFDSNGKFVLMWGKNGGKTGEVGDREGEFDNPFGVVVDSKGYVYVASRNKLQVQKFTADGKYITHFGEFKPSSTESISPVDITIDKNDNIYVAAITRSKSNFLPDGLRRLIQKYDARGKLIAKWDGSPARKNSMARRNWEYGFQQNIAVDKSGTVYFADAWNGSIQRFTYSGKYLGDWRSWASDSGHFDYPSSVAVDKVGKVYVLDVNNFRVQEFSSKGEFIAKWGKYGTGKGGLFKGPCGMTLGRAGNIIVADYYVGQVKEFNPKGEFLFQFKTLTFGPSNTPFGMATDSKENIYISDPYNNRILKYSSKGKLITTFGGPGVKENFLKHPAGIAIDKNDNIYVADRLNCRIVELDSRGKTVMTWGKYGSKNGEFLAPKGIALDANGNVYVADTGNSRIQVFSSNGKFVTTFGEPGTGNGQFDKPEGIAVGSRGCVYVTDTGNNRVQMFTPIK
jgi:sugar lactone lactonase YvrE